MPPTSGRDWCPNSGADESDKLPGYGRCRDCGKTDKMKPSGRLNQHKRPKWMAKREQQ